VHTRVFYNRIRLSSWERFERKSRYISSECGCDCPAIQRRLTRVILNTKLEPEKTKQKIEEYSNIRRGGTYRIVLPVNYIRSIIANNEQDNEYIITVIMKSLERERELECNITILDEMVFSITSESARTVHDYTLLEHYNINIPKDFDVAPIYIHVVIVFMPKESHKKLSIDILTQFQQKYAYVYFYVFIETPLKRDTEVGSFLYAKFLENLLYRCGYNSIILYYKTKDEFKYKNIIINSQYDDAEVEHIREQIIYLQIYKDFSIIYY
jgi:hypothetical protein